MQVGYTMRVTMWVLDPNASLFFLGQTDSLTYINDAPPAQPRPVSPRSPARARRRVLRQSPHRDTKE